MNRQPTIRLAKKPPRPKPAAVELAAIDPPHNPLPVGDKAAKMFAAVGITPDRYRAAKAAIGLPPTCNCAGRQAWLNRAGQWLADTLRQE